MLHHFSILFFVYKSKINSRGYSPIFCRITLNGVRKQFATGSHIKAIDWNKENQRAKGNSQPAKIINETINSIQLKIETSYNELIKEKVFVLVEDIYNRFSGNNKECKSLLEAFEHHNLKMKNLIGKDYVKATHDKFVLIQTHIKDFIRFKYQKSDFPLHELKLNFLADLDYYLKTQKGQNQNTINKIIERVKKVINIAVGNGWIVSNPFLLYQKKKFIKNVVFLSPEELNNLENYQFAQQRLACVRDFFIFSCYTGLAYNEASILKAIHIFPTEEKFAWIEMIRQKTQRPVSVPVLPQAMKILKKYGYPNNGGLLLPVISNQKTNSYLKEIAEIVGINKILTHHIARKTFASTVLINNDVPIEIVSFLLGHSKTSTTELHYAKIVKESVIRHLNKLTSKLTP